MEDGNTAALRQKEAEDDRRGKFQDAAQADSARLVDDYIADESKQHKHALQEHLTELVAGNPQFLAAVQNLCDALPRSCSRKKPNIDAAINEAICITDLVRHYIDKHEGDDLIQREADALENDTPCRCRGDCYC